MMCRVGWTQEKDGVERERGPRGWKEKEGGGIGDVGCFVKYPYVVFDTEMIWVSLLPIKYLLF